MTIIGHSINSQAWIQSQCVVLPVDDFIGLIGADADGWSRSKSLLTSLRRLLFTVPQNRRDKVSCKRKFWPELISFQVADDPETLRIKANTRIISNVAYHGDLEKKAQMEKQRTLNENGEVVGQYWS